jgi:hypothetical protein
MQLRSNKLGLTMTLADAESIAMIKLFARPR